MGAHFYLMSLGGDKKTTKIIFLMTIGVNYNP